MTTYAVIDDSTGELYGVCATRELANTLSALMNNEEVGGYTTEVCERHEAVIEGDHVINTVQGVYDWFFG